VPTDHPGHLDGPGPEPGSRLAERLSRLPPGHPSSPGYRTGEQAAEVALDSADGREAAARRPEWQAALAQGTVERVGPGLVDERASQFSARERRLADLLAGEGVPWSPCTTVTGSRGGARTPPSTGSGLSSRAWIRAPATRP
jgi:hypothetical protein